MDREYLEQFRADQENEKVFSDAKKVLSDVGLTVEDLAQKDKILDLGASTAVVERALRLRGLPDKVVSLSLEVPNQVKKAGLNYVKGHAANLPFKGGSFDLVISRNGPLYLVEKQFEAEAILNEILRVEGIKGEGRIYPARFGFIKRQLFDQNVEYFNLHSKAPAQRNSQEIERLSHYNNLANQKTLEYLGKLSFNFEVRKNQNDNKADSDFLILRK